jgi:uncharacterized SAM-binding protein YcdF (DUF218 family)
MSEFVGNLLRPYALLQLLLVLALINLWRKRQESRRRLLLLTVPAVVLVLLSSPWFEYLVVGSLEWKNPPLPQRPEETEAIIVLAGGVGAPAPLFPKPQLRENTLHRCLLAAELYHQRRRCPIIVSGGRDPAGGGAPPYAQAMRDFLLALGVPGTDLLTEENSQNTYENAAECRKILEQRRLRKVLLVTDAIHMARACRCFRKQGIEAIPATCHHQAIFPPKGATDLIPELRSASNCEAALHEWLGIAWYWVRGRI